MDSNIKRQIMLENYTNPMGKGLVDDNSYVTIRANNESCIDDINLQIKINNSIIEDIRFDGEACAISTSTTSVMIKLLKGKTIEEAKNIINNYEDMINEKEYSEDILEEANIYDEIYKQPNRIKCALLPWKAIKEIFNKLYID
ncbi:MAG: SUF system NifU family Fe-S cluster assembly protein [Bacilli bacterium]